MKNKLVISFCLIVSFSGIKSVFAQTGSTSEPIRYVGGVSINPASHEAGLRYAIGVENIQTMRANRTQPELSDGFGWTYNHASNLVYWNNTFFQQYISGEADEHVPPVQTMLVSSKDGRSWGFPQVLFPPYKAPAGVSIPEGCTGYMMHQRMGFYVAPNNRLLTLAFYAHSENPFREGGIGRVVREIYRDGSFGPIYFIRYDSHTSWNETNTSYPFYKSSTDQGFVQACDALLSDKLYTLQWWEEDNGIDGFYTFRKSEQALSWYHRRDGKVVGLWKKSWCALSDDEGKTFSDPVKAETLVMSGGKMWGQRTDDGNYAISYNPIDQTQYRFPLALVTGSDGIIFDNLLLVQAEVPPRRFFGRWKDFGPCYMRGITEGNGNPPGNDMWMTYSMNKEDMWVCRIPVPVKYTVDKDVTDRFDNMEAGGIITDWNIYSPQWAKVSLVADGKTNKCLQLSDSDACDYARAIRVFKEGSELKASLRVKVLELDTADFQIEVADQFGNRPVQLNFAKDGMLKVTDGSAMRSVMPYENGKWYALRIEMSIKGTGHYSVYVDDKKIGEKLPAAVAVKSVERLSFRTGAYRNWPNRHTPNEEKYPPLAGADEVQKASVYWIDDVMVSTIWKE